MRVLGIGIGAFAGTRFVTEASDFCFPGTAVRRGSVRENGFRDRNVYEDYVRD